MDAILVLLPIDIATNQYQNGYKWDKVGNISSTEGQKRRHTSNVAGRNMLIGQYEGKVGEKGRIAFPKKFREILGDKLIITFGYENSLIVVSQENWRQLMEGTEGRPFIEADTRETQRFLLGAASDVKLDSKGRFIIPYYLREFAKIEADVVFVGLSRYVEIWDKTRWMGYAKSLERNIDRISQRLVEKRKKE